MSDRQTYEQLADQRDDLFKQIKSIRIERDAISNENDRLCDTVSKVCAERDALRSQLAELQRQLDEQAGQEPVAVIFQNFSGQIHMITPDGDSFDLSRHIGSSLYALPPNLPAMIERAVREEREAALKPLRTAVLALAHALERDPGYRSAYEEVDAAIRARGE